MHTGTVASRPFALLRTALLLPLLALPTLPAAAQQAKCLAGKTSCMAKKASRLLKCEALAETPGKPADPNDKECVTKAKAKFDGGLDATKGCFEKLENKNPNDCLTLDDTGVAETAVDVCVAVLVAAIDPPPLDQTKCGAGKKKCASKYLAGLLKCRKAAQTPGKPTDPNTKGCIDKAVVKYSGGVDPARGCFAKLEAKNPNDCQSTSTSLTVQGLAENCVDDLVAVVAGSASTTSTTIATTPTTLATTTTTTMPPCANSPDGTACDDGSLCTTNDTCANGICVGDPACGDTCTVCHTSCDPATGQCTFGIAPDGTACGGAATPDECHQPGTCQHGMCTGTALSDGSPCGAAPAGDSCLLPGTCQSGRCVQHVQAPDFSPCSSDGNPCTLNDTCLGGVCTGQQKNCDDHVTLNFDTCDPATGTCVHTPDPSRDAACQDAGCLVGQRCCRQPSTNGGFEAACTSPNSVCEDTTGVIGAACGGFVCEFDNTTTCCGDVCCKLPDECVQGVCHRGPGAVCGNDFCPAPAKVCDFGTDVCLDRCGTGTFCLPTQQCCATINKCCDLANNQICGNTDCEAANPCPPGEVRIQVPPNQICCLAEQVCGGNCCDPTAYCDACTQQCVPLP